MHRVPVISVWWPARPPGAAFGDVNPFHGMSGQPDAPQITRRSTPQPDTSEPRLIVVIDARDWPAEPIRAPIPATIEAS